MRKIKRARWVSSDQLVQAIISLSQMWMEEPPAVPATQETCAQTEPMDRGEEDVSRQPIRTVP
jgi:hypothetical protein